MCYRFITPFAVIVAYDLKFYERLPQLFPQNLGMMKVFESNPEMVETTAKGNSSSFSEACSLL